MPQGILYTFTWSYHFNTENNSMYCLTLDWLFRLSVQLIKWMDTWRLINSPAFSQTPSNCPLGLSLVQNEKGR